MDKNQGHIDEKLLLRFLLGDASKEEIQQIEEWLQVSEQNQKLLDNYEAIWAETGKLTPHPVAVDSKSAWELMSKKVDNFEENKKTRPFKSRFIFITSSIAASLLVLFGVYQLLIKHALSIQNLQIASLEQIVKDTLPDGSQIALNKNSNITYPEHFSKNERRIKLKGEAYFNVEHNKEKPFIIETGNSYVQVLGTSFNIKSYENSEIEVIVTDGLVKLFTIDPETKDTSAIFLEAGKKGKILAETRKPIYVAEQIPDAIFWMNYTLIFNDTDLRKVFNLLENYYNIEIKVNDKRIYDCRLSTTFTNNSIDEIIDVIVATFDLEFIKEKTTFTLKGNGCPQKEI